MGEAVFDQQNWGNNFLNFREIRATILILKTRKVFSAQRLLLYKCKSQNKMFAFSHYVTAGGDAKAGHDLYYLFPPGTKIEPFVT